MGLKDLHFKLKAFQLRRLILAGGGRKGEQEMEKRPSWMTPVSHGYHVVEVQDRSFRSGSDVSDSDSVVVQREQIEDIELWFFGVFDPQVGDRITQYMQSHLFRKKAKECLIRKKSKETMRKAHVGARAKMRETLEDDEKGWRVGSASALVINGCKLVMANMGDYRVVVCRNGVAHELSSKPSKWHLSRRFFPGIFSCKSKNSESPKSRGSSALAVRAERVEADTEFVILASTGVWEVMKSQEAVNLIRHLEDAQEATECLAKEAVTRMSRSRISCMVIRLD